MTGFFPVMMFGLPGACVAMYRAARPERRQAVAGLLLSIALTSFLTGVTEPIEFTFMFLAPVLYALHAVLTGISMMLMPALGVHLGFSFSAGLFDYLLSFPRATRPLLLIPVGAVYFALYYAVFYYGIVRFNLATPGREADDPSEPIPASKRGGAFISALGGAPNVRSVDACTTRLRLVVADSSRVDVAALARLGSRGVVKPAPTVVQVVLGPIADQVADEIRAELRLPIPGSATARAAPISAPLADPSSVAALAGVLGGADNVRRASIAAGRLRLELNDADRIDRKGLMRAGARGVAVLSGGIVHVLIEDPSILAAHLGR